MDLRQILRQYIMESGNPDVIAYGGKLVNDDDEFMRFEWLMRHVVRVGRMNGARVLDVGCGFGWQAVAVALIGHARVVANDIRPTMTNVLTQRVEAIRKAGVNVDVTALCADICAANLPASSFDAILCNQTIEHVHDLRRTFEECNRVLKPGGKAVFLDDNNALNPESLAEIEEMWKKRDSSQEFIAELKAKRPIENADIEPFGVIRRRIILRANSSLEEPAVTQLTAATAGMMERDIENVARDYRPGAKLPTPPKWTWCRHPGTGEYCERQLDPFELKDLLNQCGFKTQVRHVFRRFPLSALNGVQVRAVNLALFARKPLFMLLAIKL